MKRTPRFALLLGLLLAIPLTASARPADKEPGERGQDRKVKAGRGDVDVRLQEITRQLKDMERQMRQLADRLEQRGPAPRAERMRPQPPRRDGMRPGARQGPGETMRPMRPRWREMMRRRWQNFRQGFERSRGAWSGMMPGRGRFQAGRGPGFPGVAGPMDRMLQRLEERIAEIRREPGAQRPRVMAERLRDALQEQVKQLDRFLEETRPAAGKPEAGAVKPERREGGVGQSAPEARPDRPSTRPGRGPGRGFGPGPGFGRGPGFGPGFGRGPRPDQGQGEPR